MYNILLKAHSGFRYIVFILLLLALIQAIAGWLGNKTYTESNRKINLFTLVSAHIQLLIGLALYFVSPNVMLSNIGAAMKDNNARYWTVEHLVMMIIAIVLITVGFSKSKKAVTAIAKHKTIAITYGLALIIIIVAILSSHRPLIG